MCLCSEVASDILEMISLTVLGEHTSEENRGVDIYVIGASGDHRLVMILCHMRLCSLEVLLGC